MILKAKLRDNPRLLIVTAMVLYTAMSACVKAVSGRIPVSESIFFRASIAAFLIGVLAMSRGVSFKAGNVPLLVARSLSGLLAMSCNFYALGKMTLGDLSVLGNTFPIFVAVLSAVFLDEKLTRALIVWIAVALMGILILLRPDFHFFNVTGLIVLLGAFFSAIVVIVIHQSHETEPSLRIAFYFMMTCTIVSIPLMAQHYVIPTRLELLFLTGAGVFGTGGQILMTRAYGLEDVSRLAPLAYSGVVFSFLAGLLFWGEMPTLASMAGGFIVILACLRIFRLEKPLNPIENQG